MEIVGLEAYALQWLSELCTSGEWKQQGILVEHDNTSSFWSYQSWYERVKRSFEQAFFVPASDSHGAYYKDCVNKQIRIQDNQIRPNYVVLLFDFNE